MNLSELSSLSSCQCPSPPFSISTTCTCTLPWTHGVGLQPLTDTDIRNQLLETGKPEPECPAVAACVAQLCCCISSSKVHGSCCKRNCHARVCLPRASFAYSRAKSRGVLPFCSSLQRWRGRWGANGNTWEPSAMGRQRPPVGVGPRKPKVEGRTRWKVEGCAQILVRHRCHF